MIDDADLARIAEGYRAFTQDAADQSPAYSALSAAVAEDSDVLRFLAALPSGKRHPPRWWRRSRPPS